MIFFNKYKKIGKEVGKNSRKLILLPFIEKKNHLQKTFFVTCIFMPT